MAVSCGKLQPPGYPDLILGIFNVSCSILGGFLYGNYRVPSSDSGRNEQVELIARFVLFLGVDSR